MPTVSEIAGYAGLAAVVAAGLLIASGHPWWHGAAVLAGAAVLVGAIALVVKRSRPRSGRRRRS